ncbi:CII family transcriptional regulator [Photorhabdus tasmaniensis]|uniref:Bacteriophage CII protein n=1 Tax=Photorhabdus tasmaniensis TaxID=1004159 RepID=A0ABX0GP21_9GAMM|nr:CII family transcriptional regulator [Photorhabdus tasmaniensis]NHB89574.1 hypothetical protein [Photorhabdus tasmaniensis]
MDIAQTRTKAQEYEDVIRNGIAAKGNTEVAKMVGVHHSQISRWISGNDCMLNKFCKVLEAIDFENPSQTVAFHGEEAKEAAKALLQMLEHIRESAPSVTADEANQI